MFSLKIVFVFKLVKSAEPVEMLQQSSGSLLFAKVPLYECPVLKRYYVGTMIKALYSLLSTSST